MAKDEDFYITAELIDLWNHDIDLATGVPYRRMASQANGIMQERIARLKDELQEYKRLNDVIMCAYCGHTSPKGDMMAVVNHTMECEKRPERKLLDKAFEVEDRLYHRIIHLTEHSYNPRECETCREIENILNIYNESE